MLIVCAIGLGFLNDSKEPITKSIQEIAIVLGFIHHTRDFGDVIHKKTLKMLCLLFK